VLCLGDSVTFGWGVPYEESYPARLAAALGRGIGAQAGPLGAVGAAAGGLAGLADLPSALRKRRADRGRWRAGEAEMWRHLLRHHVRPDDLLRRPASGAAGAP
jgi:hypothetical protein